MHYEDDCYVYGCQSYQSLSKRVECILQRGHSPTPGNKHTQIHMHGELPEAKPSMQDSSTLHTCQRQTAKFTSMHFLEWKRNFCQKNNLKGNIHSCFYVKWTTINRMFPLSKHHRKPHINKGV